LSLVVVGSVAFDTIETPHGRAEEELGGSAVHFALAASLLNKVRLAGHIGRDATAAHLAPLRRPNIDLRGLTVKEGKTFRWSGRYAHDMNQRETISVELNVFGQYPPELLPEYADSDFVFLANGAPAHQMMVIDQCKAPQFVVLDTMDHWIISNRPELDKLFRRVDAVVVNDSEARLLTGEEHIRAAQKVLEMGPKYVIVKHGAHGALMVSGREVFVIPAFPTTRVKDPTGAGDSFAGGVMGHLSRVGKVTPQEMRLAMAYGTIIASFNVEEFGVRRVASLTLEEVEARMLEFRRVLKF